MPRRANVNAISLSPASHVKQDAALMLKEVATAMAIVTVAQGNVTANLRILARPANERSALRRNATSSWAEDSATIPLESVFVAWDSVGHNASRRRVYQNAARRVVSATPRVASVNAIQVFSAGVAKKRSAAQ